MSLGGESKLGALFQRPFSINRRKKSELSDMTEDSASPTGSPSEISELTKQRVSAAKSYIENMYKAQSQNIQERYARWVSWSAWTHQAAWAGRCLDQSCQVVSVTV
jgi:hypothetical protein